jgi:hypothetical protein
MNLFFCQPALEIPWLSAGFAIWHQHRKENCGKAGADKQIILQSPGDVKGVAGSWTPGKRKGLVFG